MRSQAAIWVNVLIPGAGLIILRREWLGSTVALLFGMLAGSGIWGCLITPASVGAWTVGLMLTGAALIWLGGQVLLRRQLAVFNDPSRAREVERLRQQAADSASAGNYTEALSMLRLALSLNDEDLDTLVQQADLLTALGRFREARRAWRQVEWLDRRRHYRRRVVEALQHLPTG